jgi:hypothetical protein
MFKWLKWFMRTPKPTDRVGRKGLMSRRMMEMLDDPETSRQIRDAKFGDTITHKGKKYTMNRGKNPLARLYGE